MLTYLLTAALLNTVSSHLCVWQPPQRVGAFQISSPGEHVCYLKEGPCGNVATGEPMTSLVGGQSFDILFQQNLNHFYAENPGQLVADFATVGSPLESDFQPLGQPIRDYNALNEITQTNFTLNVVIPNVECEHCVIRMRYMSNNPTENDRGMIFYQCSDVSVKKQTDSSKVLKHNHNLKVKKTEVDAVDHSCCAAPQFTVQAYETGSWRGVTQKSYYFDAVNKLFRIDTNSGEGETEKDGHFQMYSNFTSGIEYYYNTKTQSCDLYGLNYWSDWCYGSKNSQVHMEEVKVGSQVSDVWGMEGAGPHFTWTNQRDQCIPIAMNRGDSGETSIFYNYKAEAPCKHMFELPSACVSAHSRLSDVRSLRPSPHNQF